LKGTKNQSSTFFNHIVITDYEQSETYSEQDIQMLASLAETEEVHSDFIYDYLIHPYNENATYDSLPYTEDSEVRDFHFQCSEQRFQSVLEFTDKSDADAFDQQIVDWGYGLDDSADLYILFAELVRDFTDDGRIVLTTGLRPIDDEHSFTGSVIEIDSDLIDVVLDDVFGQ
jgi:hypothetical protein